MTHPDLRSVVKVELAFGARAGTDVSTWTWVDVTPDLLSRQIGTSYGRQDEQSQPEPAEVTVILDNATGAYTPGLATGAHYPDVVQGTPMRATLSDHSRFIGEVGSWEPSWPWGDLSGLDPDGEGEARVTVTAAGILRRIGQGQQALESALRRHYLAYGEQLVGYIPLEEPSEAGRTASNLVPGARPVRYGTGGAPDFPLIPDWAADDTCPGSAPLPEWPVTEYFEWSLGGGTIQHIAPWQVCVTIRVPSGSPHAWLCEWRTDGTLPRWELRVLSSGLLQVRANTDDTESSVRTETWTSSAAPVDDNEWRSVAVTAVSDGSGGTIVAITVHGADEEFSAVSSMDPGQVTNLSPRPKFLDTSSDPEPIGFGHMAVIGSQSDNIIALPGNPGPADGHIGERAATRIRRLGDESGIPVRLLGLEQMLDRFDRVEASDWGDGWSVSGDATFSVDGSSGVMEMASGQEGVVSTDVTEPDDIDVLVAVEVDASPGDTAARSIALRDQNYIVAIDPLFLTFDLLRWNGASYDTVASVDFTQSFLATGLIWIRAQAINGLIRARLWHDAHPEPIRWYIDYEDTDPWLDTGASAVQGSQIGSGTVTLHWRHYELRAYDTSVPLGAQQRTDLLDAWEQAATTDHGILGEDHTAPGMAYRPLSTMYNQPAAITLDAAAGGVGDIEPPLLPVLDDQAIRNDVTVSRIGGSSSRVVDEDHIERHGRYDESPELNAANDGQTLDLAMWRLHLGTWPGMRYPTVAPALDARPSLIDTWLGLRYGDRVDIINLPPQHPAGAVELLVQGWTDSITGARLSVPINATPFGPLWVLEWADPADSPGPDDPVRYDSGGSTVASSFEAGADTSLSVAIGTGHPLWDTAADFPLDIEVAGVRLRVTAISGSSSPQTMTVQQTPINGVTKTIEAGEQVRLFRSVPWAL